MARRNDCGFWIPSVRAAYLRIYSGFSTLVINEPDPENVMRISPIRFAGRGPQASRRPAARPTGECATGGRRRSYWFTGTWTATWLLAWAAGSISTGQAQTEDASLLIYAVNVMHTPAQDWVGYGVYLGRGLVLTAAHVAGRVSETKPVVRIAGLELPAKAVKEGSYERTDLTLLQIDDKQLPINVQMRRMPICVHPLWSGEPVIVAVPEGTARSHIISPTFLPREYRIRFSSAIADVATTGNSGSGVFDLARKCLLGIISRKIQVRINDRPDTPTKDIAKYFVPAATIINFIPPEFRS